MKTRWIIGMAVIVAAVGFSNVAWAQNNHEGHVHEQGETGQLSEHDQLHIAIQKICPVSGEKLGAMGSPIKVDAGGQHVFLCCKGCMGKQLNGEHWNTIQANYAKAQGTCPIMGKPVDASMKSTTINGERIFVCCPPCIEKIQADPEASLAKVHANYAKFAQGQGDHSLDALAMQVQRICPVSGDELGAMGEPIKVNVGGQHVFVCCKGCLGKELNPQHWATVQDNLAKAQGVCPIMGKPVDAAKQAAIVNGHKIFVCCPGCIDKINASAEKPEAWLAQQYEQALSRR